ncbi:MAG: hypothetical protein MUF34_36285 [Polyangiaceae bacterium]|nr:hypothetical protein [Polyangiaceae bacterium]
MAQHYLEPAIAALERGRGLKLESPHYLEGLLAFYRESYDAAERAAELAADEAPWLYEARRLAGDVAYARAAARLDGGEYDEARAGFERAAGRYEQAAEIGRSDALNYEALAQAWMKLAEVDERQGKPRKDALARALEASGKAVRAASRRASSRTRRAQVLIDWYQLMQYDGGGEDPAPLLVEWLDTAARAVELDPGDVHAYDALGYGHFTRGLALARAGGDPGPAYDEAIAALGRALERQPNYPWALNELANVYRWKGNQQREHGHDPRVEYAEAERYFTQAIASDPKYLIAHWNLGDLYNEWASYGLAHGLDPQGEVRKAIELGGRALALDGKFYQALNQAAVAELTLAQHLVERGDDVGDHLRQAFDYLDRSRAINPTFGRTWSYRAEAHRLAAFQALRAGADPRADFDAGRAALVAAFRAEPDCLGCRITSAQLGLVEASWAHARGASALPSLRRAQADARRALAIYPHAEGHEELARVCFRLAEASPPGDARAAIDEGLAQAEEALRLDPNLKHAQAIRDGLRLARARDVRGAAASGGP